MINTVLRIMFGSKTFQPGVKIIVLGKGHLENLKSMGGNVVKGGCVLVLDGFFEGAEPFVILDLDREGATGIIAENYAMELEWERHATSKLTMLRLRAGV